MRLMRFPRLLSAALSGVAVGALVAAGWNVTAPEESSTDRETQEASTEAEAEHDAHRFDEDGDAGDVADEPMAAGADEKNDADEGDDTDEEVVAPGPSFEPLEQPSDPYPTPDMPAEPGEDSAELTRITHELEKLSWTAAGAVDEDTETDCSAGEDTLSDPGSYEFACAVSVGGTPVRFQVTAEVTDDEVSWEWAARQFPVSEDKAVHEATRQSFKPSRVTCNFSGMTLVPIGVNDGLRCWVTRHDGEQMTYHGEVLRDGSLVFRPGRDG